MLLTDKHLSRSPWLGRWFKLKGKILVIIGRIKVGSYISREKSDSLFQIPQVSHFVKHTHDFLVWQHFI